MGEKEGLVCDSNGAVRVHVIWADVCYRHESAFRTKALSCEGARRLGVQQRD